MVSWQKGKVKRQSQFPAVTIRPFSEKIAGVCVNMFPRLCVEFIDTSTQKGHRGERRSCSFFSIVLIRSRADGFNPVKLGFLSFGVETAVCHVMPDVIMDTGYWTLARS